LDVETIIPAGTTLGAGCRRFESSRPGQ